MYNVTITFNVNGQIISCNEKDMTLLSDSIDLIKARFNFSPEWQGYTKTAIFKSDTKKPYSKILVDDACMVPPEAIKKSKYMSVSVFGVSGTQLITTTDQIVPLTPSGYTDDSIVSPAPTENIYQQIVTLMQKQAVDAVRAETAQGKAEQAELTAKSHAEQTGEDRIATGEDRVAAGESATAASESKTAAANSAMNAATSAEAALSAKQAAETVQGKVEKARNDAEGYAEQTALDCAATGADRTAVNVALTGFTETTLPNAIQAVEDKANTEIARVGQAGDTQVQAVNAVGAEQIRLATAQADRAESEADIAETKAGEAYNYAGEAYQYKEAAGASASSASESETSASESRTKAVQSAGEASAYATKAKTSADNAAKSESNAKESAAEATAAASTASEAAQTAAGYAGTVTYYIGVDPDTGHMAVFYNG